MTDTKITMTLRDLERLLLQQKHEVAEYITRNLSHYDWFNQNSQSNEWRKIDIDKAKEQLRQQANKAPLPEDYNVLEKYLKP